MQAQQEMQGEVWWAGSAREPVMRRHSVIVNFICIISKQRKSRKAFCKRFVVG